MQILYPIKMSTAAIYKFQTVNCLQQDTSFCQGGSPTTQIINPPRVMTAILAEQMTQYLASHLKGPLLYGLRAFSAQSFSLSFPLLMTALREHHCPKVGNTCIGSGGGCKAANVGEGLPTCGSKVVMYPPLNKKFL